MEESTGLVYFSYFSSSNFPDLVSPAEFQRRPTEGPCPNSKLKDCAALFGHNRMGKPPWESSVPSSWPLAFSGWSNAFSDSGSARIVSSGILRVKVQGAQVQFPLREEYIFSFLYSWHRHFPACSPMPSCLQRGLIGALPPSKLMMGGGPRSLVCKWFP